MFLHNFHILKMKQSALFNKQTRVKQKANELSTKSVPEVKVCKSFCHQCLQ